MLEVEQLISTEAKLAELPDPQKTPLITAPHGLRLLKGAIGRNQYYLLLARGDIPGAVNVGVGDKPSWRIRTKPFVDWLLGTNNAH